MLQPRPRLARDGQVLDMDIGGAPQAVGDEPGRHGRIGITVDQDEGAGGAIFLIGIERDRRRRGKVAEADFVERQRFGGQFPETSSRRAGI